MKTFARHLRTRPNRRQLPRTNLSIPTAAASEPPALHSIPKPDSSSYHPSIRAASQEKHAPPPSPPPPPYHAHHLPQSQHGSEEYDKHKHGPKDQNAPSQGRPKSSPKEPRAKLYISDIVPEEITSYAYRWETLSPTSDQLKNADAFFLKYPPKLLWSEAKFKKIDFGYVPEVAFLGRSNVGKSSLLNALLNNKNLAFTSSKPGRTRLMNAFSIADGKLVLLDMPGYGHASRDEWGVQIMKYLKSRKQFRRAFLLIDAKHGLKNNDLQLLEQFGQEGISFQMVLSKIDRVKPDGVAKLFGEVRHLIENGIPGANAGLGEVLATAGDPAKKGQKKVGLSDLRWAVMVASGLESVVFEK